MIYRFIFIKILLKSNIYKIVPSPIPIKINPRNSPLLNLNIVYKIIPPEISQNKTSWIYVIISLVLKDFLNILKISNSMPIKKPFKIKIRNMYAWFPNLSPYFI